jgi:hypothetical protein
VRTVTHLAVSAKKNPEQFKRDVQQALKRFNNLPTNYELLLQNICRSVLHQLDVWHRAKNIGKALHEVRRFICIGHLHSDVFLYQAKLGRKGNRKNYEHWIRHIKNHWFWCSQQCEGDLATFQVRRSFQFCMYAIHLQPVDFQELWNGIPHHVQDVHEWPGGACRHEDDFRKEDPESHPTPLDVNSEAFKAATRVAMDKRLQDEMHYYVQFR